MRILFAAPDFFPNLKKVLLEWSPNTNRTYFLLSGRIVAVAIGSAT